MPPAILPAWVEAVHTAVIPAFAGMTTKAEPPLVGTGRDLSLRVPLPDWFYAPNHEIRIFPTTPREGVWPLRAWER